MTDSVHSIQVVLDRDIREDDIEPLLEAIKQFRYVLSVTPVVNDFSAHMAEQRAKNEMRKKLYKILENFRNEEL